MLRSLAHLMRMRLPQLSRYLETSLATSGDPPLSQDPRASTPAGYEQLRSPMAMSCCQPPSHGPQDQGHRTVPLAPSLSIHLSTLKEIKSAMPPHDLLADINRKDKANLQVNVQKSVYGDLDPKSVGEVERNVLPETLE